ncbi:tRNA (guanine(9)-N(1))-methyltransferase [Coemansia sp. Benny D115]|nr:tRNA (guanine(9)-N(1))-methyltransferase [Coemansia sp. Benny D115]
MPFLLNSQRNPPLTKQGSAMSVEDFHKLSRNQQKKVMRQELWQAHAAEYREKQRAKSKESRKRRNQRIAQEAAAQGTTAQKQKKQRLEDQRKSEMRVVLDMDFDELMEEKEIKSVCSQVMRCYSANRQAEVSVALHVTELHGSIRERFQGAMKQHLGWSKDHIVMHEKGEYLDLFQKEDLVYLTADSPNEVQTLDPTKVYVVGGIVDKNRYPRLTLDKAESQGIAHARLPIGQYVRMSTRKVMTVNQIFEMLIGYVATNDWRTAFLATIPERKFNGENDDTV